MSDPFEALLAESHAIHGAREVLNQRAKANQDALQHAVIASWGAEWEAQGYGLVLVAIRPTGDNDSSLAARARDVLTTALSAATAVRYKATGAMLQSYVVL